MDKIGELGEVIETGKDSNSTEIKLDAVEKIVSDSQGKFNQLLSGLVSGGGMSQEQYIRYLSMQYHLTKGVQRPFLTIAGHADLGTRRSLRKFIVNFANEEEFHFEVARRDLMQFGLEPVAMPFDVELWWAYFDRVTPERPFVRLGATCVLENIAEGSLDIIDYLFANAKFLTPKNTIFFKIHKHGESLPHGDQIFEALRAGKLEPRHVADLEEGARKGATLYLRMARWALMGTSD